MRLAVFDIDGTLVDTATESDAAFLEAVEEMVQAGPISPRWAAYEDATDSGIAEAILRWHLGCAPTTAQVRALQDRYLALLGHRLMAGTPIEGAASFVDTMRASEDWKVAVATGNWRAAAVYKLKVSGFDLEGVPMATADDSPRRCDILRKAIQLSGPVEKVVYVGDRDCDLRAADDVDVGFVGIGNAVRLAKVSFADFRNPAAVKAALEEAAR